MGLFSISQAFVLWKRKKMVRSLDPAARLPVWLWRSYLTSLCFTLHACRKKIAIVHRAVVGIKWSSICEGLSTEPPVAQRLKCLPGMREIQVRSLGRGDPLEKEIAIHSSTLAWWIPWREEPGRLQSMGSQRVGHDWATSLSLSQLEIYIHTFKPFETYLKASQ